MTILRCVGERWETNAFYLAQRQISIDMLCICIVIAAIANEISFFQIWSHSGAIREIDRKETEKLALEGTENMANFTL